MRFTLFIILGLCAFGADEAATKPKAIPSDDLARFWKAEQAVSAAVAACEDCTIARIARDRLVKKLRDFCAPLPLELNAAGDPHCAAPPPPPPAKPEKK